MSEFINEHNTFFGIIFILIGGYFTFKNSKTLIDEYIDKEYMSYSFTLSILLFWLVIFAGGFLLLTGHNKF